MKWRWSSRIVPDPRPHYHNPVKSRYEIDRGLQIYECRRFAVDCGEELGKIACIIGPGKDIEIAVRFVLPRERASSAHDFSTKFGAPEHICLELLKQVVALGHPAILTFHPGSQAPYRKLMCAISKRPPVSQKPRMRDRQA